MGNEASQEGEGGADQQRPAPPLVTQQSMPLPATQGALESPGGRRDSAGPQMIRRASSAGAGPRRGSVVDIPTQLDLSNLSEEERATILSVMARAQSMEEDMPPSEDEPVRIEPDREPEKCSLCRATPKEGSCVECGALCCRKCSRPIPSGKKHVCMCVRCVERYPQLSSTIQKPDSNEVREDVVVDKRRRTSEIIPHTTERMQQQGAPPARTRSDSLPSQKARTQQKAGIMQGSQPNLDHLQQKPLNDMRRPDGLEQYEIPRPQLSQQVRPQLPQQRFPVDQHRPPQTHDQHRFQHQTDQQRFLHQNDEIKPQHPSDKHQKQSTLDIKKQQPIRHQQVPDASKIQQQEPKYVHDQRRVISGDQSSPQQRNISTENQSQKHLNNHKNNIFNEQTSNSLEQQRQNETDYNKAQNSLDDQRSLPIRTQAPVDQQKQLIELQSLQHSTEQSILKQQTEELRGKHAQDLRPHHPRSQISAVQHVNGHRMPQPTDQARFPLPQPEQQGGQSKLAQLQYHGDVKNVQNSHYHADKNQDVFQQGYPLNDISKTRLQHPVIHHQTQISSPESAIQNVQSKPPQAIEYGPLRLQGPDIHQMTPPPRNQRIREPPQQQILPRPQHPQGTDNLVHYPQDIFDNANNQILQNERNDSKPHNVQEYNSEKLKSSRDRYSVDTNENQHFNDQSLKNNDYKKGSNHKELNNIPRSLPCDKITQQKHFPKTRQQSAAQNANETAQENDKDGVYVSLSEHIPTHVEGFTEQDPTRLFQAQQKNSRSPPTTLPRAKSSEVPQPAARKKRDKPPGTDTLPRTGTNPFRTDTNPFRRESLPTDLMNTGEYVMVSSRRSSLDDGIKRTDQQSTKLKDVKLSWLN